MYVCTAMVSCASHLSWASFQVLVEACTGRPCAYICTSVRSPYRTSTPALRFLTIYNHRSVLRGTRMCWSYDPCQSSKRALSIPNPSQSLLEISRDHGRLSTRRANPSETLVSNRKVKAGRKYSFNVCNFASISIHSGRALRTCPRSPSVT